MFSKIHAGMHSLAISPAVEHSLFSIWRLQKVRLSPKCSFIQILLNKARETQGFEFRTTEGGGLAISHVIIYLRPVRVIHVQMQN